MCERESVAAAYRLVWRGGPEMANAVPIVESADYLCVIGTSLNVYPAAGLINYARPLILYF